MLYKYPEASVIAHLFVSYKESKFLQVQLLQPVGSRVLTPNSEEGKRLLVYFPGQHTSPYLFSCM